MSSMDLIWTIFIFFLGLCVGSFLNVCIYRIPERKSVVSPPSHCPKCDHMIRWYENIPLLSWLFLKGRCSNCKTSISIRYFCVELLTALMFLSVWFKMTSLNIRPNIFIPLVVSNLVIVILIILTAFIDWDHRIIPDKITYPVIFYGFAAALYSPILWRTQSRFVALTYSCASVVLCAGTLAILAVVGKKMFKKDALGWGDVKYIAAVSAVLGPWASFFTVLSGSIVGAVAGLTLIAMKKRKLRSGIPFGPALAIGTYLWILCGQETIRAYLKFTASIAESINGG